MIGWVKPAPPTPYCLELQKSSATSKPRIELPNRRWRARTGASGAPPSHNRRAPAAPYVQNLEGLKMVLIYRRTGGLFALLTLATVAVAPVVLTVAVATTVAIGALLIAAAVRVA